MTMPPDSSTGIISLDLLMAVRDQQIDLTRMIYMLYVDIENQISRADSKSQLVLSTNAILAAVIASFGLQLELSQETPALATAIVISYALMFAALMLSVYFALSASIPRLTKTSGTPTTKRNLYHSSHIIEQPEDDYIDAFMNMNIQEVKTAILRQIYAKSQVLQKKYASVRRSILLLMVAIVLLAIAQAFQLTL